jgi:predicted O-methyltransferase YrrM
MRPSATTLASELTPAELNALVALLKGAGLTGPHLEIGTAAGGTLKELMRSYADVARPKFVVIDPLTYFPNQRDIVERNLRSAGIDPATVDFRVGTSWALVKDALAKQERFSFVFIDAVHKAKEVMQDLRWTRLLEPGGYVCLHDHKPRFRGVMWATRWFLARQPQYQRVALVESLAILRKTAPAAHAEASDFDIALGGIMSVLLRLRRSAEKRVGKV